MFLLFLGIVCHVVIALPYTSSDTTREFSVIASNLSHRRIAVARLGHLMTLSVSSARHVIKKKICCSFRIRLKWGDDPDLRPNELAEHHSPQGRATTHILGFFGMPVADWVARPTYTTLFQIIRPT